MKKGKPRGSSHLFKFQMSTLVNFTLEDTHISFTCELNSLAFHWQAYRLFYPSLVRIFFFSKARQVNINNSRPNLNYISAVFEDNFTTDDYGLRLVLQFFHQSWVFPKVRLDRLYKLLKCFVKLSTSFFNFHFMVLQTMMSGIQLLLCYRQLSWLFGGKLHRARTFPHSTSGMSK